MLKQTEILIQKGEMLPLMEEFYTIQGEGFHTGKAAYFIRVGGCDVGCHWCDVKESWNSDLHPPTMTDQIVEKARKYANTVVITGGEPLMWNMDYITQQLRDKNIKVHIETSGAYALTGQYDWICLSPKKNKLPLDEVHQSAHELKVIVYNKHDFKFAEEQASKVGSDCELFLQPEWSNREKMTPIIVDYVMEHPKWKISLQTHKYLNIP
ncbi:MAG: 7-carboxy-7-deazaguanine synthase QueE [Flavobacteriales bacterium]|nr:7-carboxy-7-deazaguanine synthase QueE [Flavobacteriales bacterium]